MASQEIIDNIRFILMDVSTTLLSDERISITYDNWISTYPDTVLLRLAFAKYDTVLTCLEYLIITDDVNSPTAGIDRKERVGSVTAEIKANVDYISKWEKLRDWFIAYPSEIDTALGTVPINRVYVGGVSRKEIARVNHNRDSKGGGWGINDPYPMNIRLRHRNGYYLGYLYGD